MPITNTLCSVVSSVSTTSNVSASLPNCTTESAGSLVVQATQAESTLLGLAVITRSEMLPVICWPPLPLFAAPPVLAAVPPVDPAGSALPPAPEVSAPPLALPLASLPAPFTPPDPVLAGPLDPQALIVSSATAPREKHKFKDRQFMQRGYFMARTIQQPVLMFSVLTLNHHYWMSFCSLQKLTNRKNS